MGNQLQAGFVGLGNMGGAIAERMVRQGIRLHVHDLNALAMQRLAELGAVSSPSAKAVADTVEIVFTCLPTVEASESAVFGTNGVAAGGRVRIFIEMSTVGPEAVRSFERRLSTRGVGTLDAPVSGGAAGALAGTLAIMVSGAPDVRDAVLPILNAISSSVFVIGDGVGEGQSMKLVNNLLAAANMASSYEALVLGTRLGLVPEKIVEVVNAGSGKNTGMDDRRTKAILNRKFEGLGKIALMQKDIALAFKVAEEAGFPVSALHAFTGVAKLWETGIAEGMAGEDVSALVKVVERAAGMEVRGKDLAK